MKKRFVIKAISAALWIAIFTMTNINTLDATATPTVESANTPLKVKAGVGNGSVAIALFSPNQVDIKSGESVTWYNPTPVPEPHTVTFVFDNKSMAHVVDE